jgi:hypothetical protein
VRAIDRVTRKLVADVIYSHRHSDPCGALPAIKLDARCEQLRTSLPIQRVLVPADIAALAVHLTTRRSPARR